jgi:hypothetical protein
MSSSTRAISSSGGMSDISNISQSIDYHEIYERILPYVRELLMCFSSEFDRKSG